MAKLTPYFYSENAWEQAAFYIAALGGEIQHQMTYGDAPDMDESLSVDGTVVMPLEKQFWRSLFGRVKDKFGIKWQITTAAQL